MYGIYVYMVNEKSMAIPTESESTPQYKTKVLHKHKPSEAWFPSFISLTIKEDALSVHLRVSMQDLQETAYYRTLLSSATCDWGYLPRLATKRPSRAVARCGSADRDLCMFRAWWCFTTFSYCSSEILEQHVSGRIYKTRWTSSMACSFPRLQFLWFLSLGTSNVYCLCYRSPSQTCSK